MTPPSSPNRRGADVRCTPALAVVFAAIVFATASCRTDIVGPERHLPLRVEPVAGSGAPEPATDGVTDRRLPTPIQSMVPAVILLRSEARGGNLFISGQLRFRDRDYAPFYDPSRNGGWALQVFLDTDQRNEGYWRGYDYVVRGVEWSPSANTFVTRQITLDPTTPGGWGPEIGVATFSQKPRSFEIVIPLQSLGGFENRVNYCVETYATIACPDCDGGLTQEWSDDYFATLGDPRVREFVSVSGSPHAGLAATSVLPRGHGADAAAHLAGRGVAER